MTKLVTWVAAVGLCVQFGCTDDVFTEGDPDLPAPGDGTAVEVDTRQQPEAQPVPPGTPELIAFVATHQSASRDLFAHDGVLYWIEDEPVEGPQVRGVALQNGTWGTLAKLSESPFSIVSQGDFIYVTSPFAQTIDQIDPATGIVSTFATLSAAPLGLAADRDALYATTTDGRVLRISDNGSTIDTLTTVSDTPVTIAVRGEDVFFGTSGGALHRTVTTPDLGSEKISSQHGFAGGIAMDDTHVYWASDIERSVLRVDRQGGQPETVATQLYGLSGVAVDDRFVYMTSRGDNALRRFETRLVEDTLEVVGTSFRAPADPILVDGAVYFVAESAAAIATLAD